MARAKRRQHAAPKKQARWSEEESEALIANWFTMRKVDLAKMLGRTEDGVLKHADALRAQGLFPEPSGVPVITPSMKRVIDILLGFPAGCRMRDIAGVIGFHPSFELRRLEKHGLVYVTGEKGSKDYLYTGRPYLIKEYSKSTRLSSEDDPLANSLVDLKLNAKQNQILKTFKGDSRRALAQALGITKTELNHLILTRRIKRHG